MNVLVCPLGGRSAHKQKTGLTRSVKNDGRAEEVGVCSGGLDLTHGRHRTPFCSWLGEINEISAWQTRDELNLSAGSQSVGPKHLVRKKRWKKTKNAGEEEEGEDGLEPSASQKVTSQKHKNVSFVLNQSLLGGLNDRLYKPNKRFYLCILFNPVKNWSESSSNWKVSLH